MSHGNIKEQKDVANLDKGKEAGWDMAKLDEEKAAEESKNAGAKPAGKRAFGEGTSWAKPSFGRRAPAAKFGGGDFAALDELDDEDSGKKKDTTAKAEAKAEDKEEKKSGPVKPTFRGRMNLTKTGGSAQNDQPGEGVGKAYDFKVHHATPGE